MFKLAIKLSAFAAVAFGGSLDNCRDNFFDGGADGIDHLSGICETQSKIFGCESVCNKRVKNVFGDDDVFDNWFFQYSKPNCADLCNGEYKTIDDLIFVEDYDYESRKKRSPLAKREAGEANADEDEGDSACHILASLTNGCGNWH